MMEREDVSIVKKKRKMYKTIKEINNENTVVIDSLEALRILLVLPYEYLWIFL